MDYKRYMTDHSIDEITRLRARIADLESSPWYCIHCKTAFPDGGDDFLKSHIETCPQHPLSQARARIAELEAELAARPAHEAPADLPIAEGQADA